MAKGQPSNFEPVRSPADCNIHSISIKLVPRFVSRRTSPSGVQMIKEPLLLLVAFSTAANAAEWRLAATSEDSDLGRSMAFVDANSIERTADRLSMWLELRIERPPSTADGSRAKVTADCRERWFEVSEASYLLGDRWLKPAPIEPRQSAGPGSNMGNVLDNVCAGHFLSGPVDPVRHSRLVWRATSNKD
jgi:hypothetical protein